MKGNREALPNDTTIKLFFYGLLKLETNQNRKLTETNTGDGS